MSDFLARACDQAHERVVEAQRLVPLDALREAAAERPPAPSFAEALSGPSLALIAELKRASPSRGHLAWIPDPVARAGAYVAGGAAAVSVLTEPAHFRGTLPDLDAVARAITVPVLRKDFVVERYQVWEARRAGAAAVLLIVAALDDPTLVHLLVEAWGAGLDVLVEVHDVGEADRAAAALESARLAAPRPGAPIIGVNARDLTTLTVDPERFGACVAGLPQTALAVAESGVNSAEDVARARAAGADAVLVGEHLVTAADPLAAVRRLVERTAP